MPSAKPSRKLLRARLPRPASRPRPAGMLTSEEFLDWIEPGVFADLIDGEIHMHSPVNIRHANLLNFLDHLLRRYLEETDTPGALHRESVAVRLSARETFMPDLAFFTPHQVAQFAEAHVPVAPMFCVEVLSPSTGKNDLGPKFASYELHAVQEYWVLDPAGCDHKFFRRSGDILEEFSQAAERIASVTIPGFWVRRAWFDPLKPVKVGACLREILKERRHRRR